MSVANIVSQNHLDARLAALRKKNPRVVLVAGAFDLLHPGHVRLLEQAKSLGDCLVVAVNSDSAETFHTPMTERMEIVAALSAVDLVTDIAPRSLPDLIRRVRPEIIVFGGALNSTAARLEADPLVQSAGAKIVLIPTEPGYSAAALLERIQQLPA